MQVGALYALYCLHETQPSRVRIYVPLPAMQHIVALIPHFHAEGRQGIRPTPFHVFNPHSRP